jgi:3-hydroxyisobutyrate dehydrogenase-like beta-hydroxyacid dehydrogenase
MAGTGTAAGPIGVIGLGIMGSAMGARILNSGRGAYGFDIDEQRSAEFAALGGSVASSSADIAERCRIVITSLTSATALASALEGMARSESVGTRGMTVIEASTLSVAEKFEARQHARSFGADLLDCPISGTGQQTRAGDSVAYLSGGDGPSRDAARDALAGVCRAVLDMGSFGNGTRMKLIANHLVAVHNAAAAEALVLAKRAGVDLVSALEALTSGAGSSRMLEVRGPLMIADSFDEPTMRVSTFDKDMSLIGAFADEVGARTPLFSATALLYELALKQGRGAQDTACVFAVIDSLAPLPRTS